MEISFIDLDLANVLFLLVVGFVGGLVSGFIGSGGAFVLTPAMMNMGVSAIMAVASNICHKFPKALVGAMKRHKYGQVDVKLGLVLGASAEAGVLYGAHVQEQIVAAFGKAGSNLYVSLVFVVVLAVVGGYVLRDAINMYRSANPDQEELGRLARWVQSVNIPGTMMYFPSIGTRVSVLFTIPMGFATGMLAATIAVGGFIGVPAMMYVLGVPGLMASATELVIAFVMGMGGTIKYAWSGMVDIRLAMVILAGSLFGIQLGAIGTTYVKPYVIKLVMGVIMLMVLASRGVAIPVYLSDLDLIGRLSADGATLLRNTSFGMMVLALATGAFIVLRALIQGMGQHRAEQAGTAEITLRSVPVGAGASGPQRILLVTDRSEYSAGATRAALRMAERCGAKLRVLTLLPTADFEAPLAEALAGRDQDAAMAGLRRIQQQAEAAGIPCETQVGHADEPFLEIVAAADRDQADLIIMGRRDKSDLVRAMLGGTTARVIGHASCDVMVVPRDAELEGKNILVGVDGSRHGDAALARTLGLAGHCEAPITVISVATDQRLRDDAEANARQVRNQLDASGVSANVEVKVGQPDQTLVNTAKELASDLIVMGRHGRSGLELLLLGSVSERVIGHATCPVLVVTA